MSENTILLGQHLGYCVSLGWKIVRSPFKYLIVGLLIFGLLKTVPIVLSNVCTGSTNSIISK